MSMTFSNATAPLGARIRVAADAALAWLARQPLAAVAFAAAALMATADIAFDPAKVVLALGDTDDATRLTEVRQLLAGQPWYDMTLARFGGGEHLVSHWSRIIDAPLAALIVAFSHITSVEHAELAARIVWPTFLLGLMATLIARVCDRLVSRQTALLAIALAIPCPGHFQFTPGRIDHHSGMILGTVGGTLLLLAAIDRPRLGWSAGALLGLGCAIGYEGLPPTLAALAAVTLGTIWTGETLAGPARAGMAYAVSMIAFYVIFGPFRADGTVACDALSTNLLALAACASAGLVSAHMARTQGASPSVVFAHVAIAGTTGLVLYALTDPVCLGGPFAQVEPRLGPVWLSQVSETRSLFAIGRTSPSTALQLIAYPTIALAYGVMIVRAGLIPHAATTVAIFALTLLMGITQLKLLPYAIFLCVPLIAVGLTRPVVATQLGQRRARRQPPTRVQLALGALAAITVGMGGLVFSGGGKPAAATPQFAAALDTGAEYAACTNAANIKPLAALEPGVAANDIDLGPYLVAWTGLDVVAAPYHRLGRSILAVHDLFHASATEAKARMTAMGAQYVIVCAGVGDTAADINVPLDALRPALLAGHAPDFLEPIAIGKGNVKVWRLKAD